MNVKPNVLPTWFFIWLPDGILKQTGCYSPETVLQYIQLEKTNATGCQLAFPLSAFTQPHLFCVAHLACLVVKDYGTLLLCLGVEGGTYC